MNNNEQLLTSHGVARFQAETIYSSTRTWRALSLEKVKEAALSLGRDRIEGASEYAQKMLLL